MMLSLTARRKIARASRRYGYFAEPDGKMWVRCSECEERVTVSDYTYGTVKGKYVRLTVTQQLDAGMLAHLEYCESENES
jgi:hypothetical protein